MNLNNGQEKNNLKKLPVPAVYSRLLWTQSYPYTCFNHDSIMNHEVPIVKIISFLKPSSTNTEKCIINKL